MTASLERTVGGSVALFINGDLQFDSSDERIYHEALALPALALSARRIQSPLKVLVIGGGDGLIAREMFKSSRVASLDLVDYDPEILEFARQDLSALNASSLSDARINIHVQDAWKFVDEALARAASYDVIVSDLTVAENVMEARFHSIDWYAKLARLLADKGILAVNAVSPEATPQAYWCIFNSMLKAELFARPYHISLPSFSASGFGQDWGFFIASSEAIAVDELSADLSVAAPREFLLNNDELRQLFIFPEELFQYQPKSLPACAGSDILLHYFNSSTGLAITSGLLRDASSWDITNMFVPDADTGKHILPPELCVALSKSIHSTVESNNSDPAGVQLFLHEVLDLMPSLQREQTSALIADFLEAPARFLQAIDLPRLIALLLRRAAELPSLLVAELEHLQDRLSEWADDQENLLTLGHRVVTVLILAIVVGNLLYPDSAYAKGRGTGRGYGNGGWNGGSTTYYNRRVVNPVKKGPMGPGPSQAAERDMRRNSLPQRNDVSDAEYIDESGNAYPARRYRSAQTTAVQTVQHATKQATQQTTQQTTQAAQQATQQTKAVYRLGPGSDILADGNLAMPLTDLSYLLVTPNAMHVIEQQGGLCVMALENDPDLLAHTTAEINRQLAQFSAATEQSDGAGNIARQHLSKANEVFMNVESGTDSQSMMPISNAVEVFPSVWLTPDGQYLAFRRAGGQIVFLDGKNWYTDSGKTALNEPYPSQFRSIAAAYLAKMVRNATATKNMLLADKNELVAHLDMLSSELTNYQSSIESNANFGTRKLPREEAIRLTQLAMRKTANQIQALDMHIEQLPGNIDVAKIALANVSDLGKA
jgi:spermidine synthase